MGILDRLFGKKQETPIEVADEPAVGVRMAHSDLTGIT